MFGRLILASALALTSSAALAQSSQWYFYKEQSGVEVYYAVQINRDEARVSWKCVNGNAEPRACSIGAGQDKTYRCTRDGSPLGFTNSLGERASVRANGEYVFPSDFACRGLGATAVEPYGVRISIEN
jgi:hypothetical protein